MLKVWQDELTDNLKKYGIMTLVILLCTVLPVVMLRVFRVDMGKGYSALAAMPESIRNCISFWRNVLMPTGQKYLMTVNMLMNIPVLAMALRLPANIFGDEYENGTMPFICNAPFGRSTIFWGKLLACITLYTAALVAISIGSIVFAAAGTAGLASVSGYVLWQALALLETGLMLMGVVLLYCVLKGRSTCCHDGIIVWSFLDTMLGYIPVVILAIADIIRMSDRILVLPDNFRSLLKMMRYLSPVQWCNPPDILSGLPAGIHIVALVLFAVCVFISALVYRRKSFGNG